MKIICKPIYQCEYCEKMYKQKKRAEEHEKACMKFRKIKCKQERVEQPKPQPQKKGWTGGIPYIEKP